MMVYVVYVKFKAKIMLDVDNLFEFEEIMKDLKSVELRSWM